MAVGSTSLNSTEIMASTNGTSFQTVNYARYPAPYYLIEALKSIIFFRGQYYASVGYDGVWASADGIQWKQHPEWGGGLTTDLACLATDGVSKISVVGGYTPTFSVDAGHTFQAGEQPMDRYQVPPPAPQSPPPPSIRASCYGAGGFVAVDSTGGIWTSERGEYWLLRGHFANAGEGFRAVAFDGIGRFVAVGSAPSSGSALIASAKADLVPLMPAYTVYRLKDLSGGIFDGEPRSISNLGIIAGTIISANGGTTAAILRDGVVTTYPDPVYHQYQTYANAVNDNGIAASEVLVGKAGISTYTLGVTLPSQVQTYPGGGIYSTAPSINSSGIIVGTSYKFNFAEPSIYRYDTATGARFDLGNFGLPASYATSINDNGDIAGIYTDGFDVAHSNPHYRPFRVSAGGQVTLVPTLGGTFVANVVINSSGAVAGASSMPFMPTIINATHAFLYRNGVTSDIDLFNSRYSLVNGINSNGDVVGEFTPANHLVWQGVGGNAFLYRNGVMYDLNTLLDASGDGWLLYRATSINDKGAIVGQGWFHGPYLEPFLAVPSAGSPAGVQTRFANVSTRLRTSTGDDALIAGFILRGGPKHVILRAMGPGLANRGNPSALPNLLADPTLELLNDRGERIAFNDNFSDLPYFPDQNEIGLYGMRPPFPITGSVTADSVISVTLPEGNYTAVVRGKGGTSGTALVEVYNVDTDYSPGLLNISTRGPVGTGDNVMIAGIIIRGDRERRILIRGIGPSLAKSGVANPLPDPTLEIHDQNGQIAANDDWRSNQETEISASGFAPGDERDAAVILSLWPGNYTAIVRGKDGATGNALVEVYALP
jgi:probable HAF family extracellular repeat protein